MGRLIELIVLASIACKLLAGRWPWQMLALVPRPPRPSPEQARALAQARALLGVSPVAPREAILEAHKRLIFVVHPDRGGISDLAHEANAARDLLLAELAARQRERP